ncbi:tRNA pseudouridine(65) synthase TruC [Paraglaciecola sp. 2405UD69-4]|uniref:tRNA pseudouridine(65) synthase TruC n=1 Tax=Paraglaciecola sp. 2405UD69-4 TaxID=3391836 RepID=UPI0039C9FA85
MHLDVIYQDEYIVVINKPSGLLVHRSLIDKHETQFAMQMLRDQIEQHVFPVHRLDRPTSGVLVFALSSDIARKLGEQFSQQTISKTYLAIVRGFAPQEGVIDYALKEKLDKIADKMAKQDKPAQSAQTYFTRLDTFELPYEVSKYPTARYSLVKLMPKTGRKHQLRRHLAHINHPIIGDTTHGDGKHNRFLRETFGLQQLALTCKSMEIKHPVSSEDLFLQSPLDSQIMSLLKQWQMSTSKLNELENL